MFKKFLNRFFMLCAIGLVIASSSQVLAMGKKGEIWREISNLKCKASSIYGTNTSKFEALIKKHDFDVQEFDSFGETLLTELCSGSLNIGYNKLKCSLVKFLLENGGNSIVNVKNIKGESPLLISLGDSNISISYDYYDNTQVVKLLILYGAKVNLDEIARTYDIIVPSLEKLFDITDRFDTCIINGKVFELIPEESNSEEWQKFAEDLSNSKRKEILEKEKAFRSNMRKQESGAKLNDCTAFTLE